MSDPKDLLQAVGGSPNAPVTAGALATVLNDIVGMIEDGGTAEDFGVVLMSEVDRLRSGEPDVTAILPAWCLFDRPMEEFQ
jgi:hypothetical protein